MFESVDIDITSNKKYEPLIDIVAAPIVPNSNLTFKVAKKVPAFFNKKPNVLIPEDAHLVSYVGKGLKDLTEEASFRAANTETSIHNNPFLKDLPGFNGPMARLGRVLEENEKGTLYAKNIIEDEFSKGKQKVAGVFFKPKKYDSATEAFLDGLAAAKNRAATDVDAVVPNARQAFKNLPGSQKRVSQAIEREATAKALAVDSPKEFRNMSDVKKALKSLGINATKTKTITYDTLSKFSESIHALPATESDAVIGLAGLNTRNTEYLVNKAKNTLQLSVDDAAVGVDDVITSIRRRSKDMAGDIKPALYNNPNATVNLASDGYDFYGVIKTESGNPAVIRISGDAKIDSGFGTRGITFNRYTPITENTKLSRIDTIVFSKGGIPAAMEKQVIQSLDELKEVIKNPAFLSRYMNNRINLAYIKKHFGDDVLQQMSELAKYPAVKKNLNLLDPSTPMVEHSVEMQKYLTEANRVIQGLNKKALGKSSNFSRASAGDVRKFLKRHNKAFSRPEIEGGVRDLYDGLDIHTKGVINDYLSSAGNVKDREFLIKELMKDPSLRFSTNASKKVNEFVDFLEDPETSREINKAVKFINESRNNPILRKDAERKLRKAVGEYEEAYAHIKEDSAIQNSSLTDFRSAQGGDDAVEAVVDETRDDILRQFMENESARIAKEISKKASKLTPEFITGFMNKIKDGNLHRVLRSGKAEIWRIHDIVYYNTEFRKYVNKQTTLIFYDGKLITPNNKILDDSAYRNLMKLAKKDRLKIEIADGATIKNALNKKPKGREQMPSVPMIKPMPKMENPYTKDLVKQVLATVGIVATAGFIFKKAYDTLKQVDQEMEREGYSPAERYQTMVEIAKSKEFDDKFRPVAQNLYNISTVKVPSVAERIMGLFRRN